MPTVRYHVSASELTALCCSVVQSRLTLCDPRTVAHQGLLSMGFSRQEHWSGLPFSFPGHLPDPGIKPTSPTLAGSFSTTELPGKLPPAHPRPKPRLLACCFFLRKLKQKPQPSPCPSSAQTKWAAHPSPHHASPSLLWPTFSTGITEQAIFKYSVQIKYKEHCVPSLKQKPNCSDLTNINQVLLLTNKKTQTFESCQGFHRCLPSKSQFFLLFHFI